MDNELIEKLNKYLQALTVAQRNIHILHWNVIGREFRSAHLEFKDIYEDLFAKIDEVAELIRIHDGVPSASLSECIDGSPIEEISSAQTYKVLNALKMALEDVGDVIDVCNEVAVYANENSIIDVSDALGAHSSSLGVKKYFLQSMSEEDAKPEREPRSDFKQPAPESNPSKQEPMLNPGTKEQLRR